MYMLTRILEGVSTIIAVISFAFGEVQTATLFLVWAVLMRLTRLEQDYLSEQYADLKAEREDIKRKIEELEREIK